MRTFAIPFAYAFQVQEDEAPTEATAYVPLEAEDSGNLSADPKMTERSVMSDFSDSIMGTNRSFVNFNQVEIHQYQ